ncbi:MAG: Gfo/Idh/MocA family oxidoreductase, partial [Verrucomicrobia bacterium]|nr:Gfo/Idh/MocA family oxidoreductase [Verrucomicrobiota bacterium]
MKTVSIAIVGLGSIAEYHLRAFRKTEGCRLHAVMSRKRETVERVVKDYDVEQGYVRWEDVLTDADVEAVVLCTPNDTHYAMTVQALNAGKHVLVEKPLAGNVQEAEDLCRLAERCGRRLMVAMTARFTP